MLKGIHGTMNASAKKVDPLKIDFLRRSTEFSPAAHAFIQHH